MRAQLAIRGKLLASGARHLGWKLGFGSAAAMRRLGTDRPIVGFLTDRSVMRSGDTCSLAGWRRPMLEPEIAAHFRAGVPANADTAQVLSAVGALGPAIEIADLDPDVTDLEEILACDIFHRHVLLGASDPSRAGAAVEGITARVMRDGAEIAAASDAEAMTGRVADILTSCARTLEAFGVPVRSGDVVIMGSLVPPVPVEAGQLMRAEISPLGALEVRFE